MQFIRGLICAITFLSCITLSFKGFPLAMISFVGFGLVVSGWTPAIAAIFHPMGSNSKKRLLVVFIGFAIASLGRAVVDWGGLAFINIGELKINIGQLGGYIGFIGGLLNMDKSMSD
jgi:hypothetical protein